MQMLALGRSGKWDIYIIYIYIYIYIYILDSHIAPYGASEVEQSKVRSSAVTPKEKISKSELSIVNSKTQFEFETAQ